MQQEFINLYSQHNHRFAQLQQIYPHVDLNGPFLLNPTESYYNSPIKLLIIGQETQGWGGISTEIEQRMKGYTDFRMGTNRKRSPFWQIIRKMEIALGNEKYSCAWANLNKYDVARKRPLGSVATAIAELDDLLFEEIKLLKPDVCFFFTGPDHDHRLKNLFYGMQLQPIEGGNQWYLAQLTHQALPKHNYRSYHPGYIRRIREWENYCTALDYIFKRISGRDVEV